MRERMTHKQATEAPCTIRSLEVNLVGGGVSHSCGCPGEKQPTQPRLGWVGVLGGGDREAKPPKWEQQQEEKA